MDIKHCVQSQSVKVLLVVLGVVLVGSLGFAGGLAVGFHKARFSYAFGENYERNFLKGSRMMGQIQDDKGHRSMMPTGRGQENEYRNGHGVVGEVLSLTDASLIVKDVFGNENSVTINEKTLVKNGKNRVAFSELKVGDRIAVIGQPSETGTVAARFIRVLVNPSDQ